jgi:uncharacterized protein (TIRG00374 family)
MALSAAGLVLVFRGLDWSALGAVLRQVRPGCLLAAVLVEILSILVNAVRWRWLFWPHYRPRVGKLFGTLTVAQLANTVLPGRLGLLLRVVLMGRGDNRVSRATTFTTLAVEKVLEGVTLLPLGVLLLLLLDLPEWLRTSAVAGGSLLLGFLVVLGVGLRWRVPFLDKVASFWGGRFSSVARALLDGLDSLRSTRVGGRLWLWSWIYWGLVALVNWLVIQATGLSVPPIAALVLLFVLQIGVRLPSSPGAIGVFDYLGVVSLAVFGVEKTPALGVTLLLHLVFYLPPSLLGVGRLLWMSAGLGQLRRAALEVREG